MNKFIKEDCLQIITENGGLPELRNAKLLITGSTGMIGSYILNTLLVVNEYFKTNNQIYLVVRNPQKLPEYVISDPNVKVIVQDVVSPIKLDDNLDYIIHAASPASPKIMKEQPVETNFANTLGTANALLLAKEKKVKSFLFVSSREIYGQPLKGQKVFTEDGNYGLIDHLVPRNGYAEGKKAAENMCASFKEEYGLNTKIARLAHIYGPGMSIDDGRVQADFLKNVINNENIVLKSTGESVRTYTYISDAVSGIFKILLKSKDLVYNIADEASEISIKELALTLVNLFPEKKLSLLFDIPTEVKNTGVAQFTNGILSTEKIRKELDWTPKYSISDGFRRTVEYLECQRKSEFGDKTLRR